MLKGQPGDIVDELAIIIRHYISISSNRKIGKTNNTDERKKAYAKEYKEYVELYYTKSLRNIDDVERFAIGLFDGELDNTVGGGGGRIGSSKNGYYLYIAYNPL